MWLEQVEHPHALLVDCQQKVLSSLARFRLIFDGKVAALDISLFVYLFLMSHMPHSSDSFPSATCGSAAQENRGNFLPVIMGGVRLQMFLFLTSCFFSG